jgi:hypothetical protein
LSPRARIGAAGDETRAGERATGGDVVAGGGDAGAGGGDNVGWLREFARNLATELGLELGGVEAEGEADSGDCSQADLDFLNALIEAEQDDIN